MDGIVETLVAIRCHDLPDNDGLFPEDLTFDGNFISRNSFLRCDLNIWFSFTFLGYLGLYNCAVSHDLGGLAVRFMITIDSSRLS